MWEIPQFGAKTCIYKGLTLKTTVNMAGVQSSTVATKVDISVPSDAHFKLPNYPITDVQVYEKEADAPNMDEMNEMMKNMQGLFNQQQ